MNGEFTNVDKSRRGERRELPYWEGSDHSELIYLFRRVLVEYGVIRFVCYLRFGCRLEAPSKAWRASPISGGLAALKF